MTTTVNVLLLSEKFYIMARPRSHKNKDLPTGLVYRKDRASYVFTRIDGSIKNLGKDRKRAKSLAFKYNSTYRVDPELYHEVSYSKVESEQNKLSKVTIGELLPSIFIKISEDKEWSQKTLKGHQCRFNIILKFFGEMMPDSISLPDVNKFLEESNSTDSKGVFNRYLGLLKLIFNYCVSDSIMKNNPANKKIRRTMIAKDEAEIIRLSVQDFAAIHKHAGIQGIKWLQIAMELSLQTSHAVNEIAKLKYTDIEEYISIQREKNKKTAASRVKIPMNHELEDIVQRSKNGIDSPYVVHFLRQRRYLNRPLAAGLDHPTQLRNEKISRAFSDARDELKLFDHIDNKEDRPSFHDIRSLSIQLQESTGHDAQKRAAHSQRASTEVYKKGYVQWNEVADVVIDWREQPSKADNK